jgi:hypothetical protein
MSSAARDNVVRSQSIDSVEMIPRAPDTRDTRTMKDNVNAFAGLGDGICVSQITHDGLDAEFVELEIFASRKRSHAVAARD